ncbi:MAG TPA: hypothetical protein VN253_13645 [Kofleriaceae bacterium]|nr:hypothetical protein [Kofleriaceae bacterium]
MSSKRLIMAWSSGKDSAWALHQLQLDSSFELVGLFTIFSSHERVFMHAVRPEVVHAQAQVLGVPLHVLTLPPGCGHEEYEQRMRLMLAAARSSGATHVGYGDLYLESVRRHRLELLADTGLEPVFPLWQRDTRELAREMLEGGLETYVTAVDLKKLDRTFVGRRWDEAMIARFPPGTDPCGEEGELHTCVVGGPMFAARLPFELGEIVEREGYAFADLRLCDGAERLASPGLTTPGLTE